MSVPIKHLAWGGNFKSVGDEGILEGDAIVFGSENSPDASSFKDFFTSDTFVHPEEKFTTALYMEHGFSYRRPIGKAIMVKSGNGWIATAELDMTNPVVKSRFPEIKAGGWGFSTGAVGHVVEREAKQNGTHFISQWSVGELSITRTPAEPKALVHTVKSLEEYYQVFDEDLSNQGEEGEAGNLMKIIEMLISELTKKHAEEFIYPQLEEIKTQLAELKTASVPNGTDETNEEELTVLKSENEALKTSLEELQSSFNEKETELSEKMALLSESEAELETKSQEFTSLEEELTKANEEIEGLNESLEKAKKINLTLGKTNFSK